MKISRAIMWKNRLFAALFAASLISLPGAASAALGVDFSNDVDYENGSVLGNDSNPYTIVGWSFTPNRDLYLTGLGLWDQDVEKRHSEAHQVGIWDASQTLLASVSVSEPAGSSHTTVTGSYGAAYHMESLSAPLVLKQGTVYYVGATLFAQTIGGNPDFDPFASFDSGNNLTVNNNITFLSNAYGNSSVNQLAFPGMVDTYSNYLFGANIDVVPTPVPAAVWLMGSGLIGLAGIRRRTGKQG